MNLPPEHEHVPRGTGQQDLDQHIAGGRGLAEDGVHLVDELVANAVESGLQNW